MWRRRAPFVLSMRRYSATMATRCITINIAICAKRADPFENAAAFSIDFVNLTAAGMQPQAISAGIVSSNYFQLLGLKPRIRRFFLPGGNDRSYSASDEVVLIRRSLARAFWCRPQCGGPRAFQSTAMRSPLLAWHRLSLPGYTAALRSPQAAALKLRSLSADSPPDPLLHYGLQVVVRLRSGVQYSVAAARGAHSLPTTLRACNTTANTTDGI